jgi:hypothetical protein
VLYVAVSEFLSCCCTSFVSLASWTSAICNDKSLLVFWEKLGEFLAFGCEVDGARDMTFLVGTGSIDVDYSDLAFLDGFLEILNADVGIFSGVNGCSEKSCNEE